MIVNQDHWVFAYGSNMHVEDLLRWQGEHGLPSGDIHRIVPARLPEHRLVWNYFSRARQGAAANIQAAEGEQVLGVALGVDDDLLQVIDRKEGHPHRYCRGEQPRQVEALRPSPTGPRIMQAWVYIVQPEFLSADFVAPTPEYIELMRQAALEHDLGPDYLTMLDAVLACQTDP